MTDAAKTISHEAAVTLTERYLRSIDADILKDGETWEVIIPESADTPLDDGVTEVRVSSEDSEDYEGVQVTPESAFFEQIVTAASDIAPVGMASLTSDQTDLVFPEWIEEGPLEIRSSEFTAYYDRVALCCLVRVSVETVSEFETDFLRAVAVDLRSLERLPQMARTHLERYNETALWENNAPNSLPSESTIEDAIDSAQEQAVEEVSGEIQETANEASRAAAVEFDEYREYQEQRLKEVTEDIDRLQSRLDDIKASMDSVSTQQERVELLEERKELRTELENLNNKRESLQQKHDQGFVKKRDEIYDRHAVEVNVHPVAVSLIVYERGDLDLELVTDPHTHSLTVQYATGQGVTEEVTCDACESELSNDNPGVVSTVGLIGETCCSSPQT